MIPINNLLNQSLCNSKFKVFYNELVPNVQLKNIIVTEAWDQNIITKEQFT